MYFILRPFLLGSLGHNKPLKFLKTMLSAGFSFWNNSKLLRANVLCNRRGSFFLFFLATRGSLIFSNLPNRSLGFFGLAFTKVWIILWCTCKSVEICCLDNASDIFAQFIISTTIANVAFCTLYSFLRPRERCPRGWRCNSNKYTRKTLHEDIFEFHSKKMFYSGNKT